jgi:hypothetical protein
MGFDPTWLKPSAIGSGAGSTKAEKFYNITVWCPNPYNSVNE